MNRVRQMMCVVIVCVVVTPATVSFADGDETPACKLGYELRGALGFGPNVLAAIGVDADDHSGIAAAATNYCDENRETVEPLIEAVRTARKNTFRQYEVNGSVATTDQALTNAINSLASACESVVTSMHNELSVEQKALRARFADNVLLDVRLALLDLTTEQHGALCTAQRTRDLVLKHHKKRKSSRAVTDAHEAFETAVANSLTSEQETQSAALAEAMRQNIEDVGEREASMCGGE